VLRRLTPPEKARFERLDEEVKQVFLSGGLNPSMIDLSMRRPEYYRCTLDPGSASAAPLILEMAKQLARIKNATSQNHAQVLVVSVPYGIYVSAHAFRSRQRLGFSVSPDMLTTDAADEAIRRASRMAGMPFHDVTREFRQASLQRDFFFELDGHFNPAGHQYFAETLAPLVHNTMRAQQPPVDPRETLGRRLWSGAPGRN
jgi:lysophospholipase L1-like esterase